MIDTATSTPDQIVSSLYAALGQGDIPGLMAHLADDLIVTEPSALPYGGVHTGSADFVQNVLSVMVGAAEMAITSADVYDGPAGVVGRLEGSLTSRTTGEELSLTMIEVHTVRDGLVRRIDVFLQEPELLAAFYERSAA